MNLITSRQLTYEEYEALLEWIQKNCPSTWQDLWEYMSVADDKKNAKRRADAGDLVFRIREYYDTQEEAMMFKLVWG